MMKTQLKKFGDQLLISFEGKVNYESHEDLKNELEQILKNLRSKKQETRVIFDFGSLDFVGSSGISTFVQTLLQFNQNCPTKPLYRNVRTEFQKIIKALDNEEVFHFFSDPIKESPLSKKTHLNH